MKIINTESDPYIDVSLNIYVDGTLYRAQLGTIDPGTSVEISLHQLVNERGYNLDLRSPKVSELEVRAHFKGIAVHKDFPIPDA